MRFWNRFWFAEGDLRPLALFRIAWGAACLFETFLNVGTAPLYAEWTYRLPLLPGLPALSAGAFNALLVIAAIGSVLTIVGRFPRTGALAASLAHAWIFSVSTLNFRNHIYLMCLLGFLLALSPCDRAFVLGAKASREERGLLTIPRLIAVQVWLVYAFATLNKIDPAFVDGWPLQALLKEAMPSSFVGDVLPLSGVLGSNAAMSAFSWSVVFYEAAIALGLLFPRTRKLALVLGLMLHVGIFFTMNVATFGMLMAASYVFFLDEGWFARMKKGPDRRAARPS